MSPKDHAIELLALGISQTQVATTIGVSDSYISQLVADEAFQDALRTKKAAMTEADLEFDKVLEDSEALALDRIHARLPTANMQQSLSAFKTLNTARRRKDTSIVGQTATGSQQAVVIVLPTIVVPQYTVNQSNEIIEVEGITMASASPQQLERIAEARGVVSQRALEETKQLYPSNNLVRASQHLENLAIRKVTPRSMKTIPNEMLQDII